MILTKQLAKLETGEAVPGAHANSTGGGGQQVAFFTQTTLRKSCVVHIEIVNCFEAI